MSREEPTGRNDDVTVLKAFAHPMRVRLYYSLRNAGAASVSQLAGAVGSPIAQVSYHLHQLHQFGFIEEVPQYARDRRERWWQLSGKRVGWDAASLLDEPEAAAVAAMVKGSAVREQYRLIERFQEQEKDWDPGWLDAAFMSDGTIDLTCEELARMHAELKAVIERYAMAGARRRQARQTPPPGAERVMYILHGFPIHGREQ
ncbi:helix-turn-helix domain-containing protein [Sphaerisporangium aureirubrum]|uniref:Helix-turn-helix domain-containing protein n=1 Tax=Sphaerisporangium aureirubrum TaxID=1544736 RepID=A0ABW1NVS7_9ACTN